MEGWKRMLFIIVQIFMISVLVVYVIRYITNAELPYVTDDRTALLGLLIIGFIMCCVGVLFNMPSLNWTNPWIILAAVVGTVLLFILIVVFFRLIKIENYSLYFM
jgi:hypothetical protein